MHGDEFVWDEFVGDELLGDESSRIPYVAAPTKQHYIYIYISVIYIYIYKNNVCMHLAQRSAIIDKINYVFRHYI